MKNMALTLKSVFNILDLTKCQFCQSILLQMKCTGFYNGITLYIGKILFIFHENSDWKIWPLLQNNTLTPVFNMLD